jgi:hypothetical protein
VRVATQEALGLFAHAVHLGLVLFGLVGVGLLLLPGWRESRAARSSEAWRPPATASEHEQRVAALRASVGAGALGGPPPVPSVPATAPEPATRRLDGSPWRAFAVLSCLAAGIVHLAVFPHHIVEAGLVVGGFFVAAAVWQGWWAWRLTHRVTEGQLWAGIVGSLGLIALWAWSRTWGLPFGFTDGPEKMGGWDLACEFWQVCVILCCLRGLSLHRGRRDTRLDADDPDQLSLGQLGTAAWTWAGICALALVVLSVTASVE